MSVTTRTRAASVEVKGEEVEEGASSHGSCASSRVSVGRIPRNSCDLCDHKSVGREQKATRKAVAILVLTPEQRITIT